jgi:hypothetical protein
MPSKTTISKKSGTHLMSWRRGVWPLKPMTIDARKTGRNCPLSLGGRVRVGDRLVPCRANFFTHEVPELVAALPRQVSAVPVRNSCPLVSNMVAHPATDSLVHQFTDSRITLSGIRVDWCELVVARFFASVRGFAAVGFSFGASVLRCFSIFSPPRLRSAFEVARLFAVT